MFLLFFSEESFCKYSNYGLNALGGVVLPVLQLFMRCVRFLAKCIYMIVIYSKVTVSLWKFIPCFKHANLQGIRLVSHVLQRPFSRTKSSYDQTTYDFCSDNNFMGNVFKHFYGDCLAFYSCCYCTQKFLNFHQFQRNWWKLRNFCVQ